MISQDIVDIVVAAAQRAHIPPAALLAVVEVESEGAPLEIDGRTPCLLFERHVFHRELAARAPDKLKVAKKAGLAIPKWSPSTQYKDQGRSAARLELLAKARAIDTECANRACSWGLGQTMGFLAEELGFVSATDLVAKMTAGGIPAQVEMMVAEITRKGLADELGRKDFAGFARGYNGLGYEKNQYDTKMAAADRRWERALAQRADAAVPPPRRAGLADYEVKAIQQQLVALGYPEVGDLDGKWGRRTTGAISAFQDHEGLPITGDYDDATRDALAHATPAPVSDARAATTVDDLRAAGSQTVKAADAGRLYTRILAALGLAGGATKTGLIDQAQSAVDQVQAIRPVVDGGRELLGWVTSAWWIIAIVGAVVLWRNFGAVIERRIADRVSGRHA